MSIGMVFDDDYSQALTEDKNDDVLIFFPADHSYVEILGYRIYKKDIGSFEAFLDYLMDLEMTKREYERLRKFVDAEHTTERTCGLDCARCWKTKLVNKGE